MQGDGTFQSKIELNNIKLLTKEHSKFDTMCIITRSYLRLNVEVSKFSVITADKILK